MTELGIPVGIIGLGSIAPYFLRAIETSDTWHLAAVCDVAPSKLEAFDGTAVGVFQDSRDLLRSGSVEAVVITLPNYLHGPTARDAILQRVHVCCEKPLTVDAAEARELAVMARAAGVALFTASHRRHNMHFDDLDELLPDRSQITHISCNYLEDIHQHVGTDNWYSDLAKSGGGCVIDNGPNALDMVRTVAGDLTVVDCTLEDIREGVEFGANLSLLSTMGVPVQVRLDWAYPGQRKDLQVRLKDGSLVEVDMLRGFEGLKDSLDHEYRRIMSVFADLVAVRGDGSAAGVAVVELIEEAYRLGWGL